MSDEIKHASIQSQEKYAERKATLDPDHKPIIEWGEILVEGGERKWNNVNRPGAKVYWRDAERREYRISCSNGCDVGTYYDYEEHKWKPTKWEIGVTSKAGRLGVSFLALFNRHILGQREAAEAAAKVKELQLDAPLKVAELEKPRVTVEYWIVYGGDQKSIDRVNADIQEKAGRPLYGWESRGVSEQRWYELTKNSKGWHWGGVYNTFNEVLRNIVESVKYQARNGYIPKIYKDVEDEDVQGIRAPAASVSAGVQELIEEYRSIPKTKQGNPAVEKQWLEKVDTALAELDILEQLRDEVRMKMVGGLTLG